jgi:hypothetical protein
MSPLTSTNDTRYTLTPLEHTTKLSQKIANVDPICHVETINGSKSTIDVSIAELGERFSKSDTSMKQTRGNSFHFMFQRG